MTRTAIITGAFLMLSVGCGAAPGDEIGLQGQAVRLDTQTTTSHHGGDRNGAIRTGITCWFPIQCVSRSGLLTGFDFTAKGRLRSISVWHGKFIDGMEVQWQDESDPTRLERSPHAGGYGGRMDTFDLAFDEAIVRVEGRSGDFVDRLEFFTNKGRSKVFGGTGGRSWTENEGQHGREIHGFKMFTGKFVDRIQFLSYLP